MTSGPSQGLAVKGLLALVREDTADAAGAIVPDGGGEDDALEVTATFDSGEIALTIQLDDGRRIEGTGPMPDGIESCSGSFEGVLIGPEAGDSGDWDGLACDAQALLAFNQQYDTCRAAGRGRISCAAQATAVAVTVGVGCATA